MDMSLPMISEWSEFLHHRAIFVDYDSGVSRNDALIRVLTRKTFLSAISISDDDIYGTGNVLDGGVSNTSVQKYES